MLDLIWKVGFSIVWFGLDWSLGFLSADIDGKDTIDSLQTMIEIS